MRRLFLFRFSWFALKFYDRLCLVHRLSFFVGFPVSRAHAATFCVLVAAPEISTLEQRRTSLRAEVENLVEVATQHLKTDPRHYAEDTKPRVGDGICDICVNAIQVRLKCNNKTWIQS